MGGASPAGKRGEMNEWAGGWAEKGGLGMYVPVRATAHPAPLRRYVPLGQREAGGEGRPMVRQLR